MFQSLFCWKSVWESLSTSLLILDCTVSILVLLEIGLGDSYGDIIEKGAFGFNPCFVGNRSGSNHSSVFCFMLKLVSILVLLEIGLGAL